LVLAKHMYNTRMSTLRGGIGRLAERLVERAGSIITETIQNISADGGGYLVNGRHFSDVGLAVPGDQVPRISGVGDLSHDHDRGFLEECIYQRTVRVTVRTDKPVDGQCYAVSIPRVEARSAATISFHDYFDPSKVSNGKGMLTITGGGFDVTADKLI